MGHNTSLRLGLAPALFGILVGSLMAAPPKVTVRSPRSRIRFDADWRFRKDPVGLAAAPFNWTWRPADSVNLREPKLPADLETGVWLPAKIGDDVFRGRLGYAWFRATLPTPADPANLTLHFEGIDDNAVVFLNGQRLAVHEGYSEPFDVRIAEAWKPGQPNNLVVLVQNTDGPGGITDAVSMESPRPDAAPDEAAPGYRDADWRRVHLPHDYVVEGPFSSQAPAGHGSLPTTRAWYRKTFTLPLADKGKSVWIDFDGIYRNSAVYLNGHRLGNWPSGYAGFRYDITAAANYGGRNTLAVRVDPRAPEGWWYEGGGIYRHVWLNVANPVHVRPWGTFVKTAVLGPQGQLHPDADLAISTTVLNSGAGTASCIVTSRVVAPTGATVATVRTTRNIAPRVENAVSQAAALRAVRLWSIEHPDMYRLVTTITIAGKLVDQTETPFGIRTIRFDKDRGFLLNGLPVKLKGTCNHQDFAGVGVAMPDGLLDWRIRKLKEMGSNAYRCSHNPPTAELLDACDRLGMVVMDETRHLGDTVLPKTPRGTKADELLELRSMVLRDRNHPSIIMWSLANEEPLQGSEEGAQIFTSMRNIVRALDPTRPVSSAMNGGWGRGISLVEDLVGMNYGINSYDRIRAQMPDVPMFGSETASAVATRGMYTTDKVKGYVTAYDTATPGSYAATAENAWRPIAERPWMAGAFVWTGFDYKGEPSPYGWPCVNSHFGIMDMCGFPKDTFYYYQSWWSDKPVVHVLPHWNWRGNNGHPIPVWVFSNAETVELLLNGKSLGTKTMPRNGHLEWTVPFEPGVVMARGYRAGVLVGTDKVETAGAPASLRLKTTRSRLLADEEDVTVVEVQLVDAAGRPVPTASSDVQFSVAGPGRIAGVGNGDPSSHEPDQANSRHAFNGRCMVLVGSTARAGSIVLHATSPGLNGATLAFTASLGRARVPAPQTIQPRRR